MAKCNDMVWLGFEDEFVNDKYKNSVNWTTNKIGGKPDFPPNTTIEEPVCSLCQLPQPLVVQIYAPLEDLNTHRTLYVFACINPSCWNKSESWTCLRVQSTEQLNVSPTTETSTGKQNTAVTEWCQDADDWNDDNANCNEQNGNLINAGRVSDEDDESCSFEESVQIGMESLTVDDQNANTGFGEAQGGAVGRLLSPAATAEIEGDEGEVVTIDTPTIPQHNIAALLQEVTPLPQELTQLKKSSSLQFVSYFMNVFEEIKPSYSNDHHIRELWQEYQQISGDIVQPESETIKGSPGPEENLEKYENETPIHGDKMLYYFKERIDMNPGQLLRYSRGAPPLLIAPIQQEIPKKCKNCQSEMVFEFQILPLIISLLKLTSDAKRMTRVEFGNVLVFTCKRSCWSTDVNFRHEAVVVQRETY